MVICNSLFEHILPWQRFYHFFELAGVTKQNGHILIRGIPNRLFPNDRHTYQLMFVPWMPIWLIKPYILIRNGAIKPTDAIADCKLPLKQKLRKAKNDVWLERGIRGVSVDNIR